MPANGSAMSALNLSLIGGALCSVAAMVSGQEFPENASFVGMCDASAAAAIDGQRFIVADDEDNVLRVYSRKGGEALVRFDCSEFLGLAGKKKPKEADLEAAAQLGSRTYWITSHGRNSKGKDQPSRQRLFATEVVTNGDDVTLKTVGKPYSALLDDLLKHEKLAGYQLGEAAKRAPKAPGALNIEGITATPDGKLLIGFRNPVPKGKALLVPLLNPAEVVEGKKASLGDPMELDLQGLGIRGIDYHEGRYLIIAGPSGAEGAQSRLFTWEGKPDTAPKLLVVLDGLNPEGISFHRGEGKGEYFLLSDDGTVMVDGVCCKDLKVEAKKSFRGKTISL